VSFGQVLCEGQALCEGKAKTRAFEFLVQAYVCLHEQVEDAILILGFDAWTIV
tara:strand:+ start:2937 stop:3095 length:159 start_codon:yes stop_codon:yes gene_type:complete